MIKITRTSAVLSLLSMSAIGACATSTFFSHNWRSTSPGDTRTPIGLIADAACGATMPARHDTTYLADDPRYGGDFFRMVQTYGGISQARAALDEICATQAPGLILTVYRPGDRDRDGWCVARYGEAARMQEVEDRSSGACRGRREGRP